MTEEDGEDVVGPAGLGVRGKSFSSCHAQQRRGHHNGASKLSARMSRNTRSPAATSHGTIGGSKRGSIVSHLRQEITKSCPSALSTRRVPACTGSIHRSHACTTHKERRVMIRSSGFQLQTERSRFERQASPSVWRRSETSQKAGVDARVGFACKRRASLVWGFQRDP